MLGGTVQLIHMSLNNTAADTVKQIHRTTHTLSFTNMCPLIHIDTHIHRAFFLGKVVPKCTRGEIMIIRCGKSTTGGK